MASAWLNSAEAYLVVTLQWPLWSLRVIGLLSGLVGLLALVEYVLVPSSNIRGESSDYQKKHKKFKIFQAKYLLVYIIVMLADWLQGTNMYTLYSSYGVNVGTLFLTGFLSSAIFGTCLGIFVDTWGRRFGCILFCVLEIVINLMEHVANMPLLMCGRILGGLSTSLLFSAFESWMVSEHRKQGFAEGLLADTFAIASWSNGLAAISAGFFAQIAADINGDIGPFQLAIILTVVALVLVMFWPENYGNTENQTSSDSINAVTETEHKKKTKRKTTEKKSMNGDDNESNQTAVSEGSQVNETITLGIGNTLFYIWKNPVVLMLGLSQAFFEGGMYSFVFVWVPSLLTVVSLDSSNNNSLSDFFPATPDSIPVGLVFSAFMLAMTVGGMLFGLLLPLWPGGAEGLGVFIYMTSCMAMMVPIYTFEFWPLFCAFLVMEAMVGMFNSCGATLRSHYYSDSLQSSIISLFRLPLNLFVVLGTTVASNAGGSVDNLQAVFKLIACFHFAAFVLQIALLELIPSQLSVAAKADKVD